MKKSVLLVLLVGFFTIGYSQPKIKNLSYPNSVNLFGLYEISFQLGNYDNPYDPDIIDVFVEMTAPDGQVYRVNGFYYEDYVFSNVNKIEKAQPNPGKNGWRVRFTPCQTGTWTFALHAKDKKGETILHSIDSKTPTFICQTVDNAKGFITKANSKYLKQEVVQNGKRKYHSFFPIGPNVAWYACASYFNYATPMGIYDYERYMDSLRGNANYMRIWLTRYQALSLYGPEYTQTANGKPLVYFDNTLNQKDASELDHIIQMAAANDIAVMPCILTYGDWKATTQTLEEHPSDWRNNPFNTLFRRPSDIFTDARAKRMTRNLLRYIAARWGYATNIVAWELWNEVSNMEHGDIPDDQFQTNILKWHDEMVHYLRSQDPHRHLVTTSMGGSNGLEKLDKNLYHNLDFAQLHNYQNIHKATSKSQFSYILYDIANEKHKQFPSIPVFVGEFGFGQSSSQKKYSDHDPLGIDLHNSLWSSLFSGTMGTASFWYWDVLKSCGLFSRTRPMLNFAKNLPLLSDSFTAQHTGYISKSTLVFPNNLETYYLVNRSEDTIYGWSQDTAFCYQSLRHLTNKTVVKGHFEADAVTDPNGYVFNLDADKRPKPSSRDNTITLPITNQPVGTQYVVRWYDSETGKEMASEKTTATVTEDRRGDRQLSIQFPSSIRDVKNRRVNNTFGDAVFSITKKTSDAPTTTITTENDVPSANKVPATTETPAKKVVPEKPKNNGSDTKRVTPKSIKVKPN